MPSTCSVPKCSQRGGFKFPDDKELNLAWRLAIKRVESNSRRLWTPNKHSRVCALHFKPEDFRVPEFPIDDGKSRRNLKPNVVPSIFTHTVRITEFEIGK